MPERTRSISLTLISLVVSICLALAGLEIYLRLTSEGKVKPYAGIGIIPEITDACFEQGFLVYYAGLKGSFISSYDPELGWDFEVASDRTRGDRATGSKSRETVRVIALGDSFTWGTEVEDHETYPFHLEKTLTEVRRRPAEVLNMGVGGYGIDQALLKYLRHGKPLRPDLVILGIFPHDYDRSRLTFFTYSKPLFRFDHASGAYTLGNVPVPPPDEMFETLSRKYDGTVSYAFIAVRNRLLQLFHYVLSPSDPNGYYSSTDRLVEYLLTRLRDEQDKAQAGFFIVHIPQGDFFASDQMLSKGRKEEQTVRLKRIYEKLKIPCLDLFEEFPRRFPLRTIHEEFYARGPHGATGHFSPRGNAEVAKIIAEHLEAGNLLRNSNDKTSVQAAR